MSLSLQVSAATGARVLVVNTGGTLGMAGVVGSYKPKPGHLQHQLCSKAEFKHLNQFIDVKDLPGTLIDSSNASPFDWMRLAAFVARHLSLPSYRGIVVIHGTDTMAYSTAALSFLLRFISKPVIFTGSQRPLQEPGSDAVANLIGACEIARGDTQYLGVTLCVSCGWYRADVVCCRFFYGKLLDGVRVEKFSANDDDAFSSPKVPPLATMAHDGKFAFNKAAADRMRRARGLELLHVQQGLKIHLPCKQRRCLPR
jgi:L-asparaginase